MKTKDLINLISCYYDIKESGTGRYAIHDTLIGDVTFYPGADKIQVHNGNKWVSNGFNWIIDNLEIPELSNEEGEK